MKYFLFLFSCLEMFLFFQLFVFIQSSLRHPFMPSLRDLDMLIIAILRFLCASAKLNFSGPVAIWLLASGGGILSWVFMFVLWCLYLNIWSYDVGGVLWCSYLVLSLLTDGSPLWLLLSTLDLRQVW